MVLVIVLTILVLPLACCALVLEMERALAHLRRNNRRLIVFWMIGFAVFIRRLSRWEWLMIRLARATVFRRSDP